MMKILGFLFCLGQFGEAQFYNISTVAGIGRMPFAMNGGRAVNAELIQPRGVAVDSAGNTYVSDAYYQQVFQISSSGTISVFAGNGLPGFSGDGGPATSAELYNPQDLAVDSAGNVYIADLSNSRIRKVTPSGTISTVAEVAGPVGVDVDGNGNLYVTLQASQVVRMISPNGSIITIAGNGNPGYSGDGGPASSAMLYNPNGVKVDKSGNIFIADNYNHRIRKINAQGVISTFAGNGTGAFAGDGAQATSASLFYPSDIAFGSNGAVYIADSTDGRIRMVNPSGIISTIAGGGSSVTTSAALQAELSVPTAIAIDSQDNLVFPLQYSRLVRKLTPQRVLSTIAGALPTPGAGDNLPAAQSVLLDPVGIASDSAGSLYIGDQADNRVRRVSASNRLITTVAGTGLFGSTGDGGAAANAEIGYPRGVSLDPFGNVYAISLIAAVVRKVTPQGTISRFAGGNNPGFSGDGGQATAARLNIPTGTAGDAQRNVFISDSANSRIRRVDSSGIITTFAGTGSPGFSGDNGPASKAQVYRPGQLAFDTKGNLYFADEGNNRVRRIAPDGTITTVAGSGTPGYGGDGGPALSAQLTGPAGIAVDAAGNLYMSTGAKIRKVDAATGIISTIAGTGFNGFSGDGGPATFATLSSPVFLAVDGLGNIYVTDEDNQRIRQLTPATIGIISDGSGVINGGSYLPGDIVSGSWISIKGLGFTDRTMDWSNSDFSNGLPTTLNGVQVLFNGQPGAIWYLIDGNPQQINVQAPANLDGPVTIQVVRNGVPSNTVTAMAVQVAPAIFPYTLDGGKTFFPSAVFLDGTRLGDPAIFPGARQATGGDQVILFANSLAPSPAGAVTVSATTHPVTVTIGPETFAADFSGLVAPGEFQINITVPHLSSNGNFPITIQIDGKSSQANLLFPYKN
jgi:uncharacterized protein (TIGR03437 family)